MKETLNRCSWLDLNDPLMARYHDREWDVPVRSDRKIFEFLVLEAFQAGLSWRLILGKREHFRRAFAGFDFRRVARFGEHDIARIANDVGIIRNEAKVRGAVRNAQKFLAVRQEFGTFARYMWSWVDGEPVMGNVRTRSGYRTSSKAAVAWAKDLKRRGFLFLGPVVIYAHMQATGMVNDHMVHCYRYAELRRRTARLPELRGNLRD